MVRSAYAINSVLAGFSAVVLCDLLRRWTQHWTPSLGEGPACAIAALVALSPAAVSASAYTWSESLVTTTFLLTVWWLQRVMDSGRPIDAVWAVAAATAALTTHGRSSLLAPTTIAVVLVVLWRRGRHRAAPVVGVFGIALIGASLVFTRWVRSEVWDAPGATNTPGSVVSRLDAPVPLLDSFIGQNWYQLVASVGMVGVGVGVALPSLVRPRIDRGSAIILIAASAPLMLTSVTFMADRTRADQLVYGRYADAIVWPFVALGSATVLRLGRRRNGGTVLLLAAVAALTLISGMAVERLHGDRLADDVGLRMMVPGFLPYIGGHDGIPAIRITSISASTGFSPTVRPSVSG